MEGTITKIEFPTQIVKQGRKQLPEAMRPFVWKKGVSGNPKGRPKGRSLKEFVRNYLACMTEQERINFLNGLSKEFIWRMAEGNPSNHFEVEQGEIRNPYENQTTEESIALLKKLLEHYEWQLKEEKKNTNQIQPTL